MPLCPWLVPSTGSAAIGRASRVGRRESWSDEKYERRERRQGSIVAPKVTKPAHYLTECVYLPGNQPKG
jgi:hypothetical protein